jgi:mannose-6-phosphate isomerase-like protein (cupin superfamily)
MVLLAEHEAAAGPRTGLRFPCRPCNVAANTHAPFGFSLALTPAARPQVASALAAAASFIADAVHDRVPLAALARMIGCYAQASGAVTETPAIVTLTTGDGARVSRSLARPAFEIEPTAFGAAHILHEDEVLGLYILEIAPGAEIPAHCHRLMKEWELILDHGLLQQERPVARGAAFAWPLGHVHAYRNPTDRPLRILCIDSPRFTPADEAPLIPPPPLAPLAPFAEYAV